MSNATMDDRDDQERRVQNILSRTRREVRVRDLLTFSFGRMWVVVLQLGALVYALLARSRGPNTGEEHNGRLS